LILEDREKLWTGYDRSLWGYAGILGWAFYMGMYYYLKKVKRMTSAFKNGKIKGIH